MSNTNPKNCATIINEAFTPKAIVDLFERYAQSHPQHEALVYESDALSYAKLNEKTSTLATYLVKRGVTSGSVVAISLERGFDLVIAVLAVLKAGGAFLPVDPSYPRERRQFMLEDAAPILVLTGHGHDTFGIDSLLLDTEWPAIERTVTNSMRLTTPGPDQLAYVVYTSGTTGRPKGALNLHRGLLNLALEQIATFDVRPDSRILQFASFSFDASVSEIFMALGAGATLVLGKQMDIAPGPSLVSFLQENRISHLTLPPSVLAVLPDTPLPALRVLIVAGEKCPLDLARRWAPGRKFLNAYGVSEAAVCSSIREFDPALASMPIGKAMGGVEFVVVDTNNRPTPIGETGELLIGGLGVGAGYLNRPELTQEKFVTLARGPKSNQRYYRTGDIVRVLLDGSLEYLGRKDNQVKVRGFRIELDEIASCLEEFSAVQQGAVVLRPDQDGHNQIVAYFTLKSSNPGNSPDSTEDQRRNDLTKQLRTFLGEKLPAHMIPSFLIPLSSFPLSPSGKIDLKGLPTQATTLRSTGDDRPNAETETQARLAKLCGKLLRLDGIQLNQSFLDLGGDSLYAARLAWQIREDFSVSVMESDILNAKSLMDLAALLDQLSPHNFPELELTPRTGPVDPTPLQEIFGVLEGLGVDTSVMNCCAAFELSGNLDSEILNTAYRELFERHEGLRLKFTFVGEKFKLAVHQSVDPRIEIIDFSQVENQQEELQTFFARAEKIRFDIQHDLLVRSFLIELSAKRSLFVLIAHHAVFDAWSLHIFLQDLLAIVAQKKSGRSFLVPLRIQFLDYVAWLHKTLRFENTRFHSEYFSRVLAKPLVAFDLKNALPRPDRKHLHGQNSFLTLSRQETDRLYSFCETRQITPFMACAAFLKAVLFAHSDQPDITLGGPVSVRYHRDLERQIGLYGATYVLRTRLSPAETFEDFLRRMRRGLLEAYRHPIYSIGGLLAEFNIEPDLSRTAPYDISLASLLFDLKLCEPEVSNLLEIEIKPYRFPLTTSFFDLEFTFHNFAGEVELETRFDTAIYRPEQIESLTRDFKTVLGSVLENPATTLRELKLW